MKAELEKVERQIERTLPRQTRLHERASRSATRKQELKEMIDRVDSEWRDRREAAKVAVTEDEVAQIVQSWTGIPVMRLVEAETTKLLKMEEEIHQRIIGQDEAIGAVSKAIRRARSGLKDPKRPIGSFIFLGPTGVGKTELARALAAFLFDSEEAMVRIDMSRVHRSGSTSRGSSARLRAMSATKRAGS